MLASVNWNRSRAVLTSSMLAPVVKTILGRFLVSLGLQFLGHQSAVGLVGSQIPIGSVGSLGVVLVDVTGDSPVGVDGAEILVEVDLGTLQGSPESFDGNVVGGSSSAVHADLDLLIDQDFLEVVAAELGALVGVEDFWLAPPGHGPLEGRDAEIIFQGLGDFPREDLLGSPIHDGDQVDEAPLHADVGDVGAPDVVRLRDRQVPQKIGVDAVLGAFSGLTGVLPRINGADSHLLHQAADSLTVNHQAVLEA